MILDFLIDIAKTPAILVALIAILGLALQKKPAADLIKGGLENFCWFYCCWWWSEYYCWLA